jgi:uncharacterized protein (DUF2336 family)
MPTSLSAQDVARLMSEPSPANRADLAGKVAAGLAGGGLSVSELAIAHDVVRLLARDVEATVRTTLSHALRHFPELPADVALGLANDVEAVALPILADSLVLGEADLIRIVRGGSAAKQFAIAGRPDVTEALSDALIDHGTEPAVTRLMGNAAARIAEDGFGRALARFGAGQTVPETMARRETLPPSVAERLAYLVSSALQAHLVRVHDLRPETAADIVIASREHAALTLSRGAADGDLRDMVMQMRQNGRLTPSLILRALCSGDIAFFEAAMAALAGVPLANAQILIHDPSRKGTAALYRKAAMPEALYETIVAGLDTVAETGFDGEPRDMERFRARIIARVLTKVDEVDPSDADYLVGKLADVLVHAPAAVF